MINMTKDIGKALKAEAYYSALAMALTLPDICGKTAYPNKPVKERYINFFNDYIKEYFKIEDDSELYEDGVFFNAFDCFALRCAYLHSGDIEVKSNSQSKIKEFKLVYDKQCLQYGGYNSVFKEDNKFSLTIDIVGLCRKLCFAATDYYNKNKDSFKTDMIPNVSMSEVDMNLLFGNHCQK